MSIRSDKAYRARVPVLPHAKAAKSAKAGCCALLPRIYCPAGMKTVRSICREEITQRLVPEIKRRGFVGPDEIGGNALVHQFERKTEKQHELLSIQFDKHQRPRFI